MESKDQQQRDIVLAGTDFSRASRSAANWAAAYCLRTRKILKLLHVYRPPVTVTEGGVIVPPMDDMEKQAVGRLRRMKNSLQRRYGRNLKMETEVVCGIPEKELQRRGHTGECQMIVLGMTGATRFRERMVGSTTTSVMRHSPVPLITIHDRLAFEIPKKIVVATDFYDTLHDALLLSLRQMAGFFKSEITFLHVMPAGSNKVFKYEAETAMKMDKHFKGIKHRFEVIHGDDIYASIQDYCSSVQAGLLVMIPREHSFLERLLHEPLTYKAAFHSKIPLLTLADV